MRSSGSCNNQLSYSFMEEKSIFLNQLIDSFSLCLNRNAGLELPLARTSVQLICYRRNRFAYLKGYSNKGMGMFGNINYPDYLCY